MTVLLLGPFSVLPFFCIAQLLLMQKTTAKLIVLGILCIQPLLGSFRSANPCICPLDQLIIFRTLPLICFATSLFTGDGLLDGDDFLHRCRPQIHVRSCFPFFNKLYLYWLFLQSSNFSSLFLNYICQFPEYVVVSPCIPSL